MATEKYFSMRGRSTDTRGHARLGPESFRMIYSELGVNFDVTAEPAERAHAKLSSKYDFELLPVDSVPEALRLLLGGTPPAKEEPPPPPPQDPPPPVPPVDQTVSPTAVPGESDDKGGVE